jgi:signal recognition particle receptor subunit beta
MALINFARREIEVKIVYYGPALSGKTTNVEVLHRLMPPTQRGELHSLRTEQDRTLFFDYVPIQLGEIAGFKARFKLFTVPGQVYYKETRRVVLQGADAVVFVADSNPERASANLESLVDLEENLTLHHLDLHSIPLVIQLNKRDLPDAMPVAAMTAELNPFGVPVVEAAASDGRGVLDTLRKITEIAGHRIRENLSGQATAVQLTAVEREAAEDERKVVRDHLDAIRMVRPLEEAAVQRMRAAGLLHAGHVDAVLSELVVRSEDVTPPDPIAPVTGPEHDAVDELPVPAPARSAGGAAQMREVTPVQRAAPAIPMGAPLEAWLDARGARVEEIRGGTIGAGAVQFEIVARWTDGLRRHAVELHMGRPAAPPPRPAPPPEPPPPAPEPSGALRWVAFGGATLVTALGGMAIGVLLGWIAFAG